MFTSRIFLSGLFYIKYARKYRGLNSQLIIVAYGLE